MFIYAGIKFEDFQIKMEKFDFFAKYRSKIDI